MDKKILATNNNTASISLIQKIFFAHICFALLVWNIFVATPFDIFIVNTDEFFGLNGSSILKLCMRYSVYIWIVLSIFLLCLLTLFKEYIQKLILLLLFVIAISSWINATFLVDEYGVFDGHGNLNIDYFSLLSFLQIASVLTLLVVTFLLRKNFNRLTFICISILCINVLTCVLNIIIFKMRNVGVSSITDFFIYIGSFFSFFTIATFLILLSVIFIFRKKIKRQMLYMLSFIFCLGLFISTVFKDSNKKSTIVTNVTKEDFFTYSATNPNILMILLDEYQMESFENMLNNEIKKQLEGFIWYRNTISNFGMTALSVPAIFTGEIQEEIINNKTLKQIYELVAPKSIARRFKESEKKGQVVYLKSDFSAYFNTLFPQNSTVSVSTQSSHLTRYATLLNYSIFRAVPDIIKPRVYNNEKWLIRPSLPELDSQRRLDAIGVVFPALKYIVQTRPLVKENYPPTLKYLRTALTHAPTIFDENCKYTGIVPSTFENKAAEGICAIKLVIDIINNLKSAGIFDNTMIFVFSDHGSRRSTFVPEAFKRYKQKFPYHRASSTLLIKPLGRTDAFKIDDYPSQLSDIPKTIAQAINLRNDYSGINLLSNKRVKSRIRIFNEISGKEEIGRYKIIEKYEIIRSSNNPKNWRKK